MLAPRPSPQEWDAQTAPHYQVTPITWPPETERRTWHILSANDGKTHRLQGASAETIQAAILRLRALRVEYGATSSNSPNLFLDTPLYSHGESEAFQAREILVQDFGLRPEEVQIIRVARQNYHLAVRGGPFRNAWRADLNRLINYFDPTGFRPDHADPDSTISRRYQTHFDRILFDWRSMDPGHLAAHLRAKTPLGDHAHDVLDLLRTPLPRPVLRRRHRPMYDYLHGVALRRTFPRLYLEATFGAARIALPGSFDVYRRSHVQILTEPWQPSGGAHGQ